MNRPEFLVGGIAWSAETELGRGGLDLGVCEHADLLAACDQTLDLFKLLEFRY